MGTSKVRPLSLARDKGRQRAAAAMALECAGTIDRSSKVRALLSVQPGTQNNSSVHDKLLLPSSTATSATSPAPSWPDRWQRSKGVSQPTWKLSLEVRSRT